ncbi:MAG: hypothetical protein ABJD97_15300, partial [Betaproteobacteria bacterium]
LLEANVDGGARYYVLLRPVGADDLQPWPMRMTEDAEISNRNTASSQWILDARTVDKTAAAGAWFASKAPQVDKAQAAAQSDWQRKSAAERAAATLEKADAVMTTH